MGANIAFRNVFGSFAARSETDVFSFVTRLARSTLVTTTHASTLLYIPAWRPSKGPLRPFPVPAPSPTSSRPLTSTPQPYQPACPT